jgi:tetratricopeptide (TPR) repeat protein
MKINKFLILFICFLLLCGFSYEYNPEEIDAVNNAQMRNNLGTLYWRMGKYNMAMNEFKIAIMLNPKSPASAAYYNNLGLLYLKFENFALAQDCFEHSVELNPISYEYYKNLIITYEKQGLLENVFANQLSYIAQDSSNSRAYLMAGLICYSQKNSECTIKYLSRFNELEPDYAIVEATKKIIQEMKN